MNSQAQQVYMDKFVDMASDGNVVTDYAFDVDRMRLWCKACNLTLIAPILDPPKVDFGVQEFVKLHLHKGGYSTTGTILCEVCGVAVAKAFCSTGRCGNCDEIPRPTQVTADFKKVPKTENPFAEKPRRFR